MSRPLPRNASSHWLSPLTHGVPLDCHWHPLACSLRYEHVLYVRNAGRGTLCPQLKLNELEVRAAAKPRAKLATGATGTGSSIGSQGASDCDVHRVGPPGPGPSPRRRGVGLGLAMCVLFAAITLPPRAEASGDKCYKMSYGRGVGTIPTECPDGYERNGALCYPLCRDGYEGVGPVCWGTCDPGYMDQGWLCARPRDAWALPTRDRGGPSALPPPRCPDGTEQLGALCYPPCRAGYHAWGLECVSSTPCASGYRDDGLTCMRDVVTITRSLTARPRAGSPSCASDEEFVAGMCYTKCRSGYTGVLTVCWENCRAGENDDGAFCSVPLHRIAKPSYNRGIGTPLSLQCSSIFSCSWVCPSGRQNQWSLCYVPCRSGYYASNAVLPYLCFESCPSDHPRDDGIACWRDFRSRAKSTYDRGACLSLSANEGEQQAATASLRPCWNAPSPLPISCQVWASSRRCAQPARSCIWGPVTTRALLRTPPCPRD
jgi:hypothetical protein